MSQPTISPVSQDVHPLVGLDYRVRVPAMGIVGLLTFSRFWGEARIGLSASAMAGDEEKARRVGCDDFDTKPIVLPSLLGKIEALLQRRSEV